MTKLAMSLGDTRANDLLRHTIQESTTLEADVLVVGIDRNVITISVRLSWWHTQKRTF